MRFVMDPVLERILASLHAAALGDARWTEVSGLIDEACGTKGNFLVSGDGETSAPWEERGTAPASNAESSPLKGGGTACTEPLRQRDVPPDAAKGGGDR